jgi:hypothetical protein
MPSLSHPTSKKAYVELIGGETTKHILHNQNYGSKGTSRKVKSRYACVLGYMVDGGKW